MIDQIIAMFKAMADSDEFATSLAKIVRNLVDALQEEGFSREEAISIATNMKLTGGN